MIDRPGQWPDTHIYAHELPKRFDVAFANASGGVDLSASTVTVVVKNDGLEIGSLEVDMANASGGVLWLTVDQTIYDAMGRYSTWQLSESPLFGGDVVVQGRLVKEG